MIWTISSFNANLDICIVALFSCLIFWFQVSLRPFTNRYKWVCSFLKKISVFVSADVFFFYFWIKLIKINQSKSFHTPLVISVRYYIVTLRQKLAFCKERSERTNQSVVCICMQTMQIFERQCNWKVAPWSTQLGW